MKTFSVVILALTLAIPSHAQIAMGHIHLNVSDIDAQKKFWISQFDAKPLTRPGLEGVSVPGMLILFNKSAPTHGSEGAVLDHFGFKVRNRDEMVASCRAAGYPIPKVFTGSEGFPNAYVTGPDGLKVEMQQESSLPVRAAAQHLHYLLPGYLPLRSWYVDTFAMQATTRGPHDSADIPGMNLTFAPSKTPPDKPLKGGLIDHIGFEVVDIAAWCRKLNVPCRRNDAAGFAYAFLTDPEGVSIELTEGLSASQAVKNVDKTETAH